MTDLREHLRAMLALAEATQATAHLYAGSCPDPTQPKSRDRRCPACSAMIAAAKALREADREAKKCAK